MLVWNLNIYDKYFQLIRQGKKTVEGRAPSSRFRYSRIKVWDEIIFTNLDTGEKLEVEVRGVAWYRDIREMFESEGLENVLPGVKTINAGISKYWKIADYKDRIESGGIWAIRFQLIKSKRGA